MLVSTARARILRWLVSLVGAFVVLAPMYALDPSLALTQYIHRIWQVTQGLPQAAIYSIWQTHEGYVWLGTQTGLVRFDGVRFTTVDNPNVPALKNAWVGNLFEDQQQNLWIGTNDAGLFRLHDGVIKRFSSADGLPSDSVHCLVPGRNGGLWVCTSRGLAQINGDRIAAYGPAQGLPTDAILAAAQNRDGTLWVADEHSRLGIWDGTKLRNHPLKYLPEYGSVRALLSSGD